MLLKVKCLQNFYKKFISTIENKFYLHWNKRIQNKYRIYTKLLFKIMKLDLFSINLIENDSFTDQQRVLEIFMHTLIFWELIEGNISAMDYFKEYVYIYGL